MANDLETLLATLRRSYPTSSIRTLPEPAMFLRSSTGRTLHAEGSQVLSLDGAMAYTAAYMNGLVERVKETPDYELDAAHPWIIGVWPGDLTSVPLIFIFGNIIRHGHEVWTEVGWPTYEKLEF